MQRILKAAVAVAVGLALLIFSAVPSAATAGTSTSGTATISLTPTATIPLGGLAGGHCPVSSMNITMSSPNIGTSTIALSAEFTYQGGTYLLQGAATAGVAIETGSSPYLMAIGGITWTSTTLNSVTTSSTTSTCTVGAAKCGAISLTFTSGLTGIFNGSVTPPSVTGPAQMLTGAAGVTAAACTSPFTALNGKTLAVTGWEVSF